MSPEQIKINKCKKKKRQATNSDHKHLHEHGSHHSRDQRQARPRALARLVHHLLALHLHRVIAQMRVAQQHARLRALAFADASRLGAGPLLREPLAELVQRRAPAAELAHR
jgi:G3E family GTPase